MKLQAFNFIKKTPRQVFSFDYCTIFKSTYFEERLGTAASKDRLEISLEIKANMECFHEG